MPETTNHHYKITVESRSPEGVIAIATQSGTLTLEPIATRAGVVDHLLKQLSKKHGRQFRLVNFDIKPNLR